MNRETEEFLQGLYPAEQAASHGPQINWTRGFEASPDEYEEFTARHADRREPARSGGWSRFWRERE